MTSPPPETAADLQEDRPLEILIVEPQNIVPANHGSGVRAWNLLSRLGGRAEIDLLIFHGGSDDPAQREALAPYCRSLMLEPFARPDDLRAKDLPRLAEPYGATLSRERLRDLVRVRGYDLVQFDGWELGELVLPDLAAPAVAVALDLGFVALARNAALDRSRRDRAGQGRRELSRQMAFERRAYRRSTSVQCMSAADAELLARRMPEVADRVTVVANGVDSASFHPTASSATAAAGELLFLGSFPHPPNHDAALHLAREIWPRIRALRPATRLTLAGARPDEEIRALGAIDGIHVAGELDDVRAAYAGHRVLVAPIRTGSGTRVKILEAFAAGLPVVTTTLGAEGLGAKPGEQLLIADEAGKFAEETVRLLDDGARRASIALAARRFAEERFDWARSAIAAETDYRAVAKRRPRQARRPSSVSFGNGGIPSDAPDVELVVFGAPANGDFVPLLDALAAQEFDRPVRLTFVLEDGRIGDLSAAEPPALRAFRFVPEAGYGWPAAVNDAIRELTAPALVLLDAALVPSNRDWLANLSWSLLQSSAPSVVFGAIHSGTEADAAISARPPDIDPDHPPRPFRTGRPRRHPLPASTLDAAGATGLAPWTAALAELGRRAGGRLLDLRNCGFVRRHWQAFPIPERGLSGAIWQLQTARFGALVHFVETAPARELAPPARHPRALLSEANAFARLGQPLDWKGARAAARELGPMSTGVRWKTLAALYAGSRLSEPRAARLAWHQLY